MIAQILHSAGAHHRVVKINLRHIPGRQLALKQQNFGFNAVSVGGNVHVGRYAQRLAGLLDNGGMALAIPDAEHIVQVAVADLLALHGVFVPVEPRHLFKGVLLGVV